jgi:hypothetical protein
MARESGYPDIALVARDEDDNSLVSLRADSENRALKVNLYCYNPESLAWVRMRQPQMAPLREDIIADERWEYEAGVVKYYGWHKTLNASVDDTNWFISFWEYSAGLRTRARHARGAWSNRANLWS